MPDRKRIRKKVYDVELAEMLGDTKDDYEEFASEIDTWIEPDALRKNSKRIIETETNNENQ